MSESHFTGRERQLRNRASVKVIDRTFRWLIRVGGIGTIISVLLVGVFLVWVATPLFLPAGMSETTGVDTSAAAEERAPLHLAVDEYQLLGWTIHQDSTLTVFRLDSGEVLRRKRLFTRAAPTAASFTVGSADVAFGFEDGAVRLGKIGFEIRFLEPDEITPALRSLEVGGVSEMDGGLVARTPEGQFRLQTVAASFEDPVPSPTPVPVVLVDQTISNSGPVYVTLTADGKLRVNAVEKTHNMMTDEMEVELTTGEVPLDTTRRGLPTHLKISGQGDALYVSWPEGHTVRYIVRDPRNPELAEVLDLEPGDGRLTCLTWLLGRTTLLAGNDKGNLTGWFLTRRDGVTTPDGRVLTAAHRMPAGGAPVTAIASSSRTRLIAAAYADGDVRLLLVTTASRLTETKTVEGDPLRSVTIAPREDGLAGISSARLYHWGADVKHPEASMSALFTRVWYEGYDEPQHVWQSSSGTDDFEMKLGLIPLIFGTLKATLYSLLFGVPLALLAAIYTSEFLHPRVRNAIKPTIELMASLPSVVLGFLAGLVIAPFVESFVPAALTGFLMIPVALLMGAFVWQLVPQPVAIRLSGLRFPLICVALCIGVASGVVVGPALENLLFAGDIKVWLDGQKGSGTGGWFLILLPLSAMIVAVIMTLYINPWFRGLITGLDRRRAARMDILRFLGGGLVTVVLSLVIATLLTEVGMDPRGGMFGTYVQRNALVVGFVMGFAIIPIIYTIAEDALSTIPEHLRSASLGAGATPWQTAFRIVIPTAMSGLFSAVMIGLGRAAGETMIVLMAAGNTPVLEWNIFNGFRTLSANIAVELPEAVQGSTHYRTLFLAALTLFAMTFVLNTIAEIVRLRFRKRSHEL